MHLTGRIGFIAHAVLSGKTRRRGSADIADFSVRLPARQTNEEGFRSPAGRQEGVRKPATSKAPLWGLPTGVNKVKI